MQWYVSYHNQIFTAIFSFTVCQVSEAYIKKVPATQFSSFDVENFN